MDHGPGEKAASKIPGGADGWAFNPTGVLAQQFDVGVYDPNDGAELREVGDKDPLELSLGDFDPESHFDPSNPAPGIDVDPPKLPFHGLVLGLMNSAAGTLNALWNAANDPWGTAESLKTGFDRAVLKLWNDPWGSISAVGGGIAKYASEKWNRGWVGLGEVLGDGIQGAGAAKAANWLLGKFGGTRVSPKVVEKPSGNLSNNLRSSLERIKRGESFPHRNDGSIFQNREGLLPNKPPDYYKEFVHPTPGIKGPGAQRIIIGEGGEIFYTPDHYKTFFPVIE